MEGHYSLAPSLWPLSSLVSCTWSARRTSAKPPSHRLLRHKTNRLDDTPAAVSKAPRGLPAMVDSLYLPGVLSLTLRAARGRMGRSWFFTVASKVISFAGNARHWG